MTDSFSNHISGLMAAASNKSPMTQRQTEENDAIAELGRVLLEVRKEIDRTLGSLHVKQESHGS